MKINLLLTLCALSFIISGCSSTKPANSAGPADDGKFKDRLYVSDDDAKKEWQNFEKKLIPIPKDAIEDVRDYIEENLNGVTDDELDIVRKKEPEIKYNSMKMEYCFFWNLDEHFIIEVITTPPPCQPFAVYRTKRIYFP
jgi:hypothetical protein